MIDRKTAEAIHAILIERFGGGSGIRDVGALESALARPFVTFDQSELYPNALDKAAAILESLLINHPFVDGNKRTAYVLTRLTLMEHGIDLLAAQDEKYAMVIAASKGEMRFNGIREWLASHCVAL